MSRACLIVLDSVGIGGAADAASFGDEGADTLGNLSRACGGLSLPNMEKMGLGCSAEIKGLSCPKNTTAAHGRLTEQSKGKDTTSGHWELAGLPLEEPFALFPNGFPKELIEEFEQKANVKIIGNKAASGTEIIKELGEEHIKTKKPIVYTSADSVFQIAAHEEVIPIEKLYDICLTARKICDRYRIGRVIARPFVGDSPENFKRTPRRKDFSMEPTSKTILDIIKEKGLTVFGVGKIYDIFAGRGITDYVKTENNEDGIKKTVQALQKIERGLIFTNLIDFDMLYGHRRDVDGYKRAIENFDSMFIQIDSALNPDDLLIITADHGCDPTFKGTDHTRENVPVLAFIKKIKKGTNLGRRSSFADVGATIAEFFNLKSPAGKSFLPSLY